MGCCGTNEVDAAEADKKLDFDPNFKGPIKNRSCTDIICFLIFIVFFAAFITVGIWAYTQGDPSILLYPTDTEGNLCGYSTGYTDKPFLFFFDLLDCTATGIDVNNIGSFGCPTPQICVSACPTETWTYLTGYVSETANGVGSATAERAKMLCRYTVDPTTDTSTSMDSFVNTGEQCASYYLKSTAMAGRCIPEFLVTAVTNAGSYLTTLDGDTLLNKYNETFSQTDLEAGTKYLAFFLNAQDYGSKVLQDVRASWWMILIGIALAMVWCMTWICLLRCLAGIMVWLSLILFLVTFGAATGYCFYTYYKLAQYPSDTGTVEFTTNVQYYLNLKYSWLCFGIVAALLFLIVLIILVFLRKRIKIAIALINITSKAIGHMFSILFWPIFPWIMQLLLLGYWIASAIYLASTGKKQYSFTNTTSDSSTGQAIETVSQLATGTNVCNVSDTSTTGQLCNFLKYGGDEYTIYLQFFQIFMYFWMANFIVALSQMTMAGAYASYYWTFKKPDDLPNFPVLYAVGRSLRYHVGTMAFGALIIAIIQLIRVVLEYLDHKLKDKESRVAKCILKCCKCCFWCLEKIIKYINKNAYILTSIYGYNFCRAAMRACSLLVRNIIRVAVVNRVTAFIIFVSKLVVVAVIAIFAWTFFSGTLYQYLPASNITDYVKNYTPELNFYLVPVFIIAIGAFLIATAFFSVYNMGVDTMFLCFLEDEERNDGSPEKPYYMPKGLLQIIDAQNEKKVEAARS